MKATIFLFFLAAITSVAAARNVTFHALDQDGTEIGYLSAINSGYGFDYYFLDYPDARKDQYYIDGANVAQLEVSADVPYVVGSQDGFLAVGSPINPVSLVIQNDLIGNWKFWACYDANDPYGYSTKYRTIMVTERDIINPPASKCVSVEISVVDIPILLSNS